MARYTADYNEQYWSPEMIELERLWQAEQRARGPQSWANQKDTYERAWDEWQKKAAARGEGEGLPPYPPPPMNELPRTRNISDEDLLPLAPPSTPDYLPGERQSFPPESRLQGGGGSDRLSGGGGSDRLSGGAGSDRGERITIGETTIVIANPGAEFRNLPVHPALLMAAAQRVEEAYGPGYTLTLMSGGQSKKGTIFGDYVAKGIVGSTRHDYHDGGSLAGDFVIEAPDGTLLANRGLDPLANVWIGVEGSMGINQRPYNGTSGSMTHLDLIGGANPAGRPIKQGDGKYQFWYYEEGANKYRFNENAQAERFVKAMGYRDVKEFQADNGLEPDGVIGPITRTAARELAAGGRITNMAAVARGEVVRAPIALSPVDRDAAIKAVLGEAIGEGKEGMAAIANVIFNRFDNGFGSSVAAIATDENQFKGINNKQALAYGPETPEYQMAGEIVDEYSGAAAGVRPPDNTKGATFFHSGGKDPSWWANAVEKIGQIGGHIFGKAVGAYKPRGFTLKQGRDSDARVAMLQQQLASVGLYKGTVDGIYGSGTKEAVRAWQESRGMRATGIADSPTLQSLKLPTTAARFEKALTINPELPGNRAKIFPEDQPRPAKADAIDELFAYDPLAGAEKRGTSKRPAEPPAPSPIPTSKEARPDTPLRHRVARGDTFGKIAKRYLGDANRWREVEAANPGINARSIQIGTEINVPGVAGPPTPQARPDPGTLAEGRAVEAGKLRRLMEEATGGARAQATPPAAARPLPTGRGPARETPNLDVSPRREAPRVVPTNLTPAQMDRIRQMRGIGPYPPRPETPGRLPGVTLGPTVAGRPEYPGRLPAAPVAPDIEDMRQEAALLADQRVRAAQARNLTNMNRTGADAWGETYEESPTLLTDIGLFGLDARPTRGDLPRSLSLDAMRSTGLPATRDNLASYEQPIGAPKVERPLTGGNLFVWGRPWDPLKGGSPAIDEPDPQVVAPQVAGSVSHTKQDWGRAEGTSTTGPWMTDTRPASNEALARQLGGIQQRLEIGKRSPAVITDRNPPPEAARTTQTDPFDALLDARGEAPRVVPTNLTPAQMDRIRQMRGIGPYPPRPETPGRLPGVVVPVREIDTEPTEGQAAPGTVPATDKPGTVSTVDAIAAIQNRPQTSSERQEDAAQQAATQTIPGGAAAPGTSQLPQSRSVYGFQGTSSGVNPAGISYVEGTVNGRPAIQTNNWTAVENPDGTYSHAYK